MENKKRNILLICAAIFIGSYIARSFVVANLRMAYARQQASSSRPKPVKPVAADNPDSALAAAAEALGNLSGVWEGRGRVPGGRGLCDVRLELKQNEPGHYSGYSRFSCISMEPLINPKDINAATNIVNHMNPDSAILTGTVEKGAIRFHADKTIGTDINGCAVTDLTITPFGASAVAAEWQEGACQGGNLLMQRQAR